MRRIWQFVTGIVAVAVALALLDGLFVVRETEQVLVLQFGDPRAVVQEPGLSFKTPWIQNLARYDKRVLSLDPPTEEVILNDQKRILVDSFARYRIVDPLRFFQSVRNEATFDDRFGRVLNSTVREVLAQHDLTNVLSSLRNDIMGAITTVVAENGTRFGIEIVDIRIGRTELPEQVSQNVYARMRSEREQEANKQRAEGEEIARRVRAEADRQQTVILAEARREASILRGEGDANRHRILADAYGRDPEFFDFFRSLEAYRDTFSAGDSTMVLSPGSDFFRYFGDSSGGRRGAAPAQ